MGRTALCLPLALLFLASVISSNAQSADVTAGGEAAAGAAAGTPAPALGAPVAFVKDALLYDVRGDIVINCTIPNETKLQYIWHKNGTDVASIETLKERYSLGRDGASFHIKQSVEDDYGNYSCALVGQPETNQTWAVRGRPYLKLPANSNVVEGQNLKIVCKVIGKPYPTVQWLYTNSTEEKGAYYDVSVVLGSRVRLMDSDQGVPDGVLVLGPAARDDAGSYSCNATDATLAASTVLRVKDMYAALWPFLGICAEVFVLCAIILVYEKRRTKPDLDDSDTDNHDQKKS